MSFALRTLWQMRIPSACNKKNVINMTGWSDRQYAFVGKEKAGAVAGFFPER